MTGRNSAAFDGPVSCCIGSVPCAPPLPMESGACQPNADPRHKQKCARRNFGNHTSNAAIQRKPENIAPLGSFSITRVRRCGASAKRKPNKEKHMVLTKNRKLLAGVAAAAVIIVLGSAVAQQGPRGKTSYMPID